MEAGLQTFRTPSFILKFRVLCSLLFFTVSNFLFLLTPRGQKWLRERATNGDQAAQHMLDAWGYSSAGISQDVCQVAAADDPEAMYSSLIQMADEGWAGELCEELTKYLTEAALP